MKSFAKTATRAIAALLAVAFVTLGGVCTPAFADGVTSSITNARTGTTYTDLATATAEAQSGDTILLGEGNYTLYGVSSEEHTKGKNLTFEGQGTDKTAWNIGAEVPDPNNYGTEYNGDYSFNGAGTVTFKKMTLRSGSVDYLGFIRADNTVVDGCVIKGKTCYWGYKTAVFKNTTFNAPSRDYAIWTYSSPVMSFNGCTFNASGKVVNVYTDYSAGSHDITVNVNNCQFNSKSLWGFYKQALNINDSNMGNFKYILNITNSSAKAGRDKTTCSQLFGFGGNEKQYNTGRTDVTIDGTKVWSGGKMLSHSYTDGEREDNFKDEKNYVWEQKADGWYCTGHAKCGYCGWKIEETVKATSVDTATCTEKGTRTYTATFSHKCFKPQTKTEALDPLGHDWGEPEYSWAKQDGDWYCTAKRVCKRDATHVQEETVQASAKNTPATCTGAGEDVYTATFSNKAFEAQTKAEALDPLGHDWGEPVYTWAKKDGDWYCTAKRICKRDASHVEEETVKVTVEHAIKSTCDVPGKDIYTATFSNEAFKTQTKTVILGVLGHDWGKPKYTWSKRDGEWFCTAKRTCKRDASHVEEETVKASVETTPATCTGAGKSVYTAAFENEAFEAQKRTVALGVLGHDWGEPEYSWSEKSGNWYCTAKRVCKRDASHVDEQTVKATVKTTPATCTEEGESVYAAKFDGDAFEAQTKAEKIAALGHDWGKPKYTWSKRDGEWFCTAKRTCKRDASHVEEETVKAAYEVTTPATTEKEGEGTYTATFENEAFETQTKTESIDKLPVKPQEPAKPKDDKPSKTGKPSKSDKTNKQTLPGTGDSTANVIMAMLSMAAICFAGSAIASKMRK